MLKKVLLLAGVALALVTAASADIPWPPCNPCCLNQDAPGKESRATSAYPRLRGGGACLEGATRMAEGCLPPASTGRKTHRPWPLPSPPLVCGRLLLREACPVWRRKTLV